MAKLIGAETDEVVLVPNATHALNVVLRNFEWREGDVIVGGEHDTPSSTNATVTDQYPSHSIYNVWRRVKHDSLPCRSL